MSASPNSAASSGSDTSIVCQLAGSSWYSVPFAEIAQLRGEVTRQFPQSLSGGLLKQVDDQSLVALLALKQAVLNAGLQPEDCQTWGLIAAPRTLGRKRVAESLVKFHEQGAWSVSPHVIPHCSLHSLPGLLSQVLRLNGPNFGVGGMRGSECEAFWAALALLEGDSLPGVWIVMTGWDRDTISQQETSCQAAVLGLRRVSESSLPRLRLLVSNDSDDQERLTLESVGEAIRNGTDGCWNIGGGLLTLSHAGSNVEVAA